MRTLVCIPHDKHFWHLPAAGRLQEDQHNHGRTFRLKLEIAPFNYLCSGRVGLIVLTGSKHLE